MNSEARERRTIREAGKLTVSSLAVEAGVERWVLYQKHGDLREEFLAQVRALDAPPAPLSASEQRLSVPEEERAEHRKRLREALDEIEQLSRALAVLSLENDKVVGENARLKEELEAGFPSGISPIRRGRQPTRRRT